MSYRIEYLGPMTDEGHRLVKTAAMVFPDEEAAIEGASALLQSGIPVAKVVGPRGEIGRRAIEVRVASLHRSQR